MQNLLKDLETLLAKDARFVADGKILKNAVVEHALKIDPALVKLLKSNPVIRKHFFVQVDDVLVFDKVKFQDFVSNRDFLPNSYTAFENKVGLTSGWEKLAKSKDVVLAWAYKDCVLEGGMTKEESARNEIFYNTTLAPDEITRLFDPKVFTNFEYWDANAVKKGKATPPKSISQSRNLLIKGNNLLALHCLKKKYAGTVKLIYIDPPFNTDDDSFRYNDSFNHSTWLTFIKNRLEVAKLFLSKEGFICVHIGNEEMAYLKVLMDEVFGRENFRNIISLKTNEPSGFKATSKNLFSTSNYLLIYSATPSAFLDSKNMFTESLYDENYKHFLLNKEAPLGKWEWVNISQHVAKTLNFENSKIAIEKLGKELFGQKVSEFAIENAANIFRTAAIQGGAKKKRAIAIEKSKNSKNKIFQHPNEDVEDFLILNGEQIIFYSDRIVEIEGEKVPGKILTDIWTDISMTGIANEGEVILKNGKKPEKLLKRLYELFSLKRNDFVLDFFAGSGTTPAVAHKMGINWIAIEQMEYIKDLPELRIKNVLKGEQTGISKLVDWKGGGDFIYCEIMEWNERHVQSIHKAKNTSDLIKIYSSMKKEAFFRYDIDPSAIEGKEFKELDFKDQQRALLGCLEKNHLYVNFSEIDDKEYSVSDEDKKMTRQLYAKD